MTVTCALFSRVLVQDECVFPLFFSSIADCQLSKACFAFVKEHGKDVLVKNLSKNFLIHLVNLFDFSLIRPDVVQRAYAMLENLRYSISPAP